MTLAAAQFGMIGSANAQAIKPSAKALPEIKPGTHTSFGPLKQIDAGVLNIGYAEAGPADGPPVILLHGWPYDIYSFVDVAPLLASAGYRVIVPYVRGYGTTRFLSADTVRNGQQSVVALDVIALMDALKIQQAIIGGFDWGARSADIVAALWPERCKALVSVSGYLIGSQAAGMAPLPPKAELQWWYQYYFATDRGRDGYDKYRHDFSKLIWQIASPKWNFDDATFDRSAAAFDNPDHVAIVIHNYRWRLGLAQGEAKYDDVEKQLAAGSGHHRADHHHGRRRQRRAARRAQRLRQQILRQIFAPDHFGRHRPQSAARGAARLCRSDHRRRRSLIGAAPCARIESAPENRGALVLQWSMIFSENRIPLFRIMLLTSRKAAYAACFCFDGLAAVADRDLARLLGLGDLAHQVDVQETVLEARALHLDEIGELEHALEGARRDALIEHLAALAFVLGVFLAADGQRVLLGYDGQLGLLKPATATDDAVRILAGPLDIVGRITGSGALEALIEQREQPVEADGGTIKGS